MRGSLNFGLRWVVAGMAPLLCRLKTGGFILLSGFAGLPAVALLAMAADSFLLPESTGLPQTLRSLLETFAEPDIQILASLCLAIYFALFLWVAYRFSEESFWRLTNPNLWLAVFVAWGGISRLLTGAQLAPSSRQAVGLLAGVVLAKAVAFWCGRARPGPAALRQVTAWSLSFFLAACSVPRFETGLAFQYRGVTRWSGPWNNPNICGLLMAMGAVLGLCLLLECIRRLASEVPICDGAGRHVGPIESIGKLRITLLAIPGLLALVLGLACLFGVARTYSRGAWVAFGFGLAYLACQISPMVGALPPRLRQLRSVAHRNALTAFLLATSLAVITLWQFRDTEVPLLRRTFSVANANDFSWRNRLTAWQGAWRIMADHPLSGLGWGLPERAYDSLYRPPRLTETVAIQMNDYLILGASAGLPTMAAFLLFLWFSFASWPSTDTTGPLCRSGALVLAIGFMFDGGLFKIPTAVPFWVLLGLAMPGLSFSAPKMSLVRQIP